MDFIIDHLLSLILFIPVAGAVIITLLPKDQVGAIRWVALITTLFPLGLSLVLWTRFDSHAAGFQFVEQAPWFTVINSSYHLGVDGISVAMILLTAILMPLAVLFSFSITEKVKAYMALFLLLGTGMFGVFMTLDLILFFLFWEAGLIPMYFLINIWGSANRQYASFKFFIYTMAGSLGLLLAIQTIGITLGSFDMLNAIEKWPTFAGAIYGIPATTIRAAAFWAFTIAFAIKVPVWPFHTWLPDAHTEAPTAGSMILAGVLLKLGAYGFLRLVLPLYPAEAKFYAGALAFLALMAIVAGALASFGQTDFKRLVAYSSVGHMGFVVLGIAVAAVARDSEIFKGHAIMAANGAVLQMFNHGLSSAGMFLLVGVIYDRTHTRNLNDFGGLFPLAPVYGGILIFTSMASLGLPGLNGFVSEFMVVRGAWPVYTVITAIGMLGLLMTGAYILKGIQKVLHGPVNQRWAGHRLEISRREVIAIAPLLALMLVIGVWPAWLVSVINAAITRMMG
ncbi:MAG TPA: NADH-quinone oxidoreductase subunit M [Anaerolineales bacterium]|nr:NADH-quinone oxidoreductase subunit M [Anaerolineales bacterium]